MQDKRFYEPVDSKDFPDYYLYIKNPMDLATLEKVLCTGIIS